MIDVRIHASNCKLDAHNSLLLPCPEKRCPCPRDTVLVTLPTCNRAEIEAREYDREAFNKLRIFPPLDRRAIAYALCDLQIQEVKPLQSIIVLQNGIKVAHNIDDILNTIHSRGRNDLHKSFVGESILWHFSPSQGV